MQKEIVQTPESKKAAWLYQLANFIVEANMNTWAADGTEVEPERPGHKELEYKNGDWTLRDSFTGYFNAPGMTIVSYKDMPAWTMAYSGGMTKGNQKHAKDTFVFLKESLMRVTPQLPYRGPRLHLNGNWHYDFRLVENFATHTVGDLEDFSWLEHIHLENNNVFVQKGNGGIVVDKDNNGDPVYPWDI